MLNILPLDKAPEDAEQSVFSAFDYIIVEDSNGYSLPIFKAKTPKVVKNFINAQITNEINRKFKNRLGPVSIDDFDNDRLDIKEAINEDSEYLKFFQTIDWKTRFEIIDEKIKEIDEMYGADRMKFICWPNIVKAIYLSQSLIPKNKGLEAGEPYKLRKGTRLEEIANDKLKNQDSELVIFTNRDNQYYITKSIYGYPVIRKLNLDEFWRLSIGE